MARRLENHYPVLFTGPNGTCAHEFILDLRPIKAETGIDVEDVASARAIRRRVGDAVRRWRAANGDCYWAHANDARHPPLLS